MGVIGFILQRFSRRGEAMAAKETRIVQKPAPRPRVRIFWCGDLIGEVPQRPAQDAGWHPIFGHGSRPDPQDFF
jgi:hypothetical protein